MPALILALLLVLLVPAAASGAPTVSFTQDVYAVPEGAGRAVITIRRTGALSQPSFVHFGTTPMTAHKGVRYRQVKGKLEFGPSTEEVSFSVPLRDNQVTEPDQTVKLSLYGLGNAVAPGRADSTTAVLKILDDEVQKTDRDPSNPLGLATAAGSPNPLAGASFFVDRKWALAARSARSLRRQRKLGSARLMQKIADQPGTTRFGSWDKDIRTRVSGLFRRAQAMSPGTIPLISTYRFPHRKCGDWDGGGPRMLAKYKRWIDAFARGIGNSRTVIFHEIDATITNHCLSKFGQDLRAEGMRYAVDKLTALPHTVVYIDAGAADGPYRASQVAKLLRRFGIAKAQGFFLNSTHHNWTRSEVAFGERVSRLVGGKHFVVNTAVNGRGPLRPKSRVRSGNTIRCNPKGRGLGTPPTTQTGNDLVDMFAWIGQPGRSAGPCGGADAPPTGAWWPEYALQLAKRAVF